MISTELDHVIRSGDGATTSFSFSPLTIYQSSDLKVYLIDESVDPSNPTLLTEGTGTTNYSVSVPAYPGTGTITYPASGATFLSSTQSLYITVDLPLTQDASFENNGGYSPKTIERLFDKMAVKIKTLWEGLDRSLKIPRSFSATPPSGTIDRYIAGYFVKAKDDGTGFEMGASFSLGDITTPISIANGGTAGTTAALARTNLDVPGLATTNTFTAAQSISSSAAGTAVTLTSTDAGAASGPNIVLTRNSANPAASDILGALLWFGNDSGAAAQIYGSQYVTIADPTAASEDSNMKFSTTVAGVDTVQLTLGPGATIGNPTGGDKGAGTLNVDNGIYIDTQPVGQTITFSADKGGSGADTLTSGAFVQITFGTENWDIGNAYASNAWTPPAGKYQIIVSVDISTTNAVDNENLSLSLRKNGAGHRIINISRPGTGGCSIGGTILVDANGTDVFTVAVLKSGAGNGATGTAATVCFFQGTAL